jgi:hypothetical protein
MEDTDRLVGVQPVQDEAAIMHGFLDAAGPARAIGGIRAEVANRTSAGDVAAQTRRDSAIPAP